MKNSAIAIYLIFCTAICNAQRLKLDKNVYVDNIDKIIKVTPEQVKVFAKEKFDDLVPIVDNFTHNPDGIYRVGDVLLSIKLAKRNYPKDELERVKRSFQPQYDAKPSAKFNAEIAQLGDRQFFVTTDGYGNMEYDIFYLLNKSHTVLVQGILLYPDPEKDKAKDLLSSFVRGIRFKSE